MRKLLSIFLALAMVLSLMTVSASAVEEALSAQPGSATEHWFYDQLTEGGKAIYDALWDMYRRGMMEDGKTSYDLADNDVVSQRDITAYLDGDCALFNDFSAAKDAFDLEHPEVWYVDSSYLSFRVTQDAKGRYHAFMGPGRSDNYYVTGVRDAGDVRDKTREIDAAIASIAAGAEAAAGSPGTKDAVFEQVRYVHKQITKSISYRFETDCRPGNAGYLRTVYGLVTHEGVCEAYARSMQLVLNELGIPCVLVHGYQTSGTPEAHMWNAVRIAGEWYVVDATWDDPVGLDAIGNIKNTGVNGEDGGETETYLLVGQNVTGAHWQPSGYVSTSVTAFRYPEIALTSYGMGALERNGLKVVHADSTMDGKTSTLYQVSFNGDGLVKAAKKGYYFLVKMYDINADGSVHSFKDWYYSVHGLHGVADHFDPDNDFRGNGNVDFYDTDEYLVYNVINCEYVEFAITTKAPPAWKSAEDLLTMDGYYRGDGSDILAETGLICNENGDYEQPPYVKNVSPGFTAPVYTGTNYAIHIEFTDPLYHPNQASVDNAVKGKVNDAKAAMGQTVAMDYRGTTYAWGVNARQPHTFADKRVPQNINWSCGTHGTHTGMNGIGADCRLTTLEYEFSASQMWADDSVQYEFYLTGLVGKESNRFPVNWSYVFENRYPFNTCPLVSGYNWSLWGQPQLLDNPNDLDLSEMVVKGVDGKEESLAELASRMRLDDAGMNGRLMLVVEDLSSNGSRKGELAEAAGRAPNVDIPENAVLGSSIYEIDFARICRCTIVETGQSVRLCVGFPKGIDASMAGIVFKAYHFTRNDRGEIVSVEEIPIAVTPYGLVITCKSFSPFEIVALKAGAIGETPGTEKSVVLLAGEGGRFLRLDGTNASGENGVVTLAKGQHVTLKVQCDAGQAVSAVSFDGHEIPVSDGGTVVIAYEDIASPACVLSASFISKAVLRADKDDGMVPVAPDTSGKYSSAVPDRLERTPGIAPESSTEVDDLGNSSKPGGPKDPDGSGTPGDLETDNGGTGGPDGAGAGSLGNSSGSGNKGPSGSSGNSAVHRTEPKRSSRPPRNDNTERDPDDGGGIMVSFIDVPEDAYYYDAVQWTYENGITGGTTADTFSPDNPCTRAQVMTFLWRAAGEPEPKSFANPFDDVAADAYYSKAILWAYEQGVTGGTTPTTFAPDAACTRAQVVTFLWRAAGEPVSGAGNFFGDVAPSSYYSSAVDWAVERGVTGGTTAFTFSPDNVCTRAHVVTFLYRDLAG